MLAGFLRTHHCEPAKCLGAMAVSGVIYQFSILDRLVPVVGTTASSSDELADIGVVGYWTGALLVELSRRPAGSAEASCVRI